MAKPAVNAAAPAVSSGSPRRFEFHDGGSSKFWQISRTGANVAVCFGKVGKSGQTQVKSFADAELEATDASCDLLTSLISSQLSRKH